MIMSRIKSKIKIKSFGGEASFLVLNLNPTLNLNLPSCPGIGGGL